MSQFYSLRWGHKISHMVPGFVLRQLPSGAVLREHWDLSRAVEDMGRTTWTDLPCSLQWLTSLAGGAAKNGGC